MILTTKHTKQIQRKILKVLKAEKIETESMTKEKLYQYIKEKLYVNVHTNSKEQ